MSPLSSLNDRKCFVGGVPSEVDSVELKTYFERFGPITESKIVRDIFTQRHRGFGFITFATDEGKANAFQQSHTLRGREVELRNFNEIPSPSNARKRKIFVGGINPSFTESDIESYFSRFAQLERVEICRRQDGRSRGYGFVTFQDEEACAKVLEQRTHMITLTDKVDIRPDGERGPQQISSGANSYLSDKRSEAVAPSQAMAVAGNPYMTYGSQASMYYGYGMTPMQTSYGGVAPVMSPLARDSGIAGALSGYASPAMTPSASPVAASTAGIQQPATVGDYAGLQSCTPAYAAQMQTVYGHPSAATYGQQLSYSQQHSAYAQKGGAAFQCPQVYASQQAHRQSNDTARSQPY